MAGYCSARKLTNVKGRIDYISNPKRQECIESYYNTADTNFWSLLAAECQQQHKQQVQKKIVFENGQETVKTTVSKCCEAREFIVGIPQDYKITAKEIAEWFKAKYGVECSVALHWKEKTQNFHAHIIYAERTLLKEPAIIEHKRTYYYDADGKKCKKADAVKVVPKGIETRYFSDKNKDFKTTKFALNFKTTILANFGLNDFDKTRHYPTRHIGKGNDKERYIRAYNELVGELNSYFDLLEDIEPERFKSRTPKEYFSDLIGADKFYVPEIDDIREYFAKFKELYPITSKTAEKRFESLTDDDLIAEAKVNYLYQQKINNIYNYTFTNFGCPLTEIKHNASWYQNKNQPVNYKNLKYAIAKVNEVAEAVAKDENIEIEQIPEQARPDEAYNIAEQIKNIIKEIIEEIFAYINELLGEIKDRNIDYSIDDLENELNNDDFDDDKDY